MFALWSEPYRFGVIVAAVFVAAAIAARIVHRLVHRLLDALDIDPEDRAVLHARAKHVTAGLTLLAYGLAAIASISLALTRFGVREPQWEPRQLAHGLLVHGINVVIIIVGAYVVVRAAHLAIGQLQARLGRSHALTDLEWQRRAATIGGILTNLVGVAVVFVTMLMLLHEVSIDITAILTGAGIAGVALGFGAQNLVRDVISGFFIILEDQIRVGDLARLNGVVGIIQQINLRTIVLRDGDGAVQVFPSGTITSLANLSKQFAYATVDVRVAYTESIDRVIGTIQEVAAALQQDPEWGPLIAAPLEILGIESLAEGEATVRTKVRTLPFKHGTVGNELRRRLLAAFVRRRIRPYV